jgi:hypothetical protein
VHFLSTVNRYRRLVDLARDWQDVQTARRFLTALAQRADASAEPVAGRTLPEWFSWVEQMLAQHDHDARTIFEKLSRE